MRWMSLFGARIALILMIILRNVAISTAFVSGMVRQVRTGSALTVNRRMLNKRRQLQKLQQPLRSVYRIKHRQGPASGKSADENGKNLTYNNNRITQRKQQRRVPGSSYFPLFGGGFGHDPPFSMWSTGGNPFIFC